MDGFKITTGPTSPSDILRFADELESAIDQVMTGDRKAGKLPVEPMARLIQFARDHINGAHVESNEPVCERCADIITVHNAGQCGTCLSLPAQSPTEKDMAQLIARLSRALAKADPNSAAPAKAMEFLQRKGFVDQSRKNILRGKS